MRHRLHAITLATCLGLSVASPCQADSVTKLNVFLANSAQNFSFEALVSFAVLGIKVKPLGNTQQVLTTFVMPITETIYGPSKFTALGTAPYAGGSIGSGLWIERNAGLGNGNPRITLANFRTDYHTKQVLADATIAGQKTVQRMPIYTFNVARPMAQEPNELGMPSLDEELNQLRMTPEGIALFVRGLNLPPFIGTIMRSMQFGTLNQSVILLPRLPPANDAPYVAP